MLGTRASRAPSGHTAPIGHGRHVAGKLRLAPLTTPHAGARPAPRRPSVARHVADDIHGPGILRTLSFTAVLIVTVGLGWVAADRSLADTTYTRNAYTPLATNGWRNDAALGRTASADQYAEAKVVGLRDARYGAGFRLRYANRNSQVLVAVSGTRWMIQPSRGPALVGTFQHEPSGNLRVEIQGRTVRVRWNGALVANRQITGTYPGRHVIGTVRQPTVGVTLRSVRASSLPRTTPATPAPSTGGTWWSGAASDQAADGSFATWRGSAVRIGGTWTDTYDAQTDQWMICEGPWSRWNAPLDLAVGAIFHDHGQTWAAAARGAYTARWTAVLTRIKTCWGKRDPGNLYLRFAHEMNLASVPWSVRKGEEADFVAAVRLFSDLRYRILPAAKLVFCPNDGTDSSLGGLDVRRLWPGRDAQGRRVADVFAVDSYNSWPHVTTAAAFTEKINKSSPGGTPLGLEKYRQLAASLGVPFAVSEWSNDGDPVNPGGGGESPVYVQQFNAWARAHAGDVKHPRPGQLLYEVHFNLWTQYAFWPQTRQPRTAAAYRALVWGR
jgi:hypothetical protein